MGSGYVIDHCTAALSIMQEERQYRFYVTDALKNIAENTAGLVGGKIMSGRYADLIIPQEPEEERTEEEVVNHITARLKALG